MTPVANLPPQWERLQQRALMLGVGGMVGGGVGFLLNPSQFFRSYLLAYVFWMSLPLGCLALVMLHHLVGGAWGAVIRRVLESGTRTLPLMVLLFLPILFGLPDLYHWAVPEVVATDTLLQHKSPYLNIPFFMGRTAVYFVIWITLTYWLNRWSRAQDQATAEPFARRLRLLSGPGLVLYVLTMTFAAVDWVMSLEPHWFSTLYGILVIVSQLLATMAFVVLLLERLAAASPLVEVLSPNHFHDLGNLLFAFVLVWAYMAFSQFLIIWSANLPEEITWYQHRMQGGWQWMGISLIVFYFAFPFLFLLSRDIKRQGSWLVWVAGALLAMHLVERFWSVVPAFQPAGVYVHWLDLVTLLGVGGTWLAFFVWQLKGRPLLPRHDSGLEGTTHHG